LHEQYNILTGLHVHHFGRFSFDCTTGKQSNYGPALVVILLLSQVQEAPGGAIDYFNPPPNAQIRQQNIRVTISRNSCKVDDVFRFMEVCFTIGQWCVAFPPFHWHL
jgi:hypothetical protein